MKQSLPKLIYHISRLFSKKNKPIGFNPAYLASVCDPDIVIDVGVGYGTHDLYQAYPKATFYL